MNEETIETCYDLNAGDLIAAGAKAPSFTAGT